MMKEENNNAQSGDYHKKIIVKVSHPASIAAPNLVGREESRARVKGKY